MSSLFAQATGMPNNGASNAEDFQPLTRNPQPTQGGLQPGTVPPQNPSNQDVLSQENTRIVVPVGDDTGEAQSAQQTPAGGGINWLLVVVVAVIIVAALEYFFRRRDRRTSSQTQAIDTSPQEVITVPTDESEESAESEQAPEPKPAVASNPKKKTTAKKKTKSKSKRKKSRK